MEEENWQRGTTEARRRRERGSVEEVNETEEGNMLVFSLVDPLSLLAKRNAHGGGRQLAIMSTSHAYSSHAFSHVD